MGEIITLNNEGKVTCLNLGGQMMRLKTLGSFLLHCGNTCRVINLGGTDIFLSEWKRAVQEATAKEVDLVLEKLHMGGNGIGGSGHDVLDLMETIPFFKKMSVLDLRYNDLTPDHISKVADFVIRNPKCSIQVLYLEGNSIQCRGCQAIGDLLRHSTSLIELYLGANRIGVEGARALALGLNKNATLRKLYLEGNMIGPEGADSFRTVLEEQSSKNCKMLQHLYVDNNGIGKVNSERLALALNSETAISGSFFE
jgi:Ran GTPase-activating protein (RanGAP) involved in mRNA processing and transport